MRRLRALAALIILLALLVGIPLGLVNTTGNPLDGWADLKVGDLSDNVVIDILAAVAYLAWAQFAVSVIIEAASAIRRTPLPGRIPGVFSGQQQLARTLVTTALLLGAATAAVASPIRAFAATTPTPVAASTQLVSHAQLGDEHPGLALATATAAAHTSTDVQPATYSSAAATTVYVLPRNGDGPDTLWDIAEAKLGSGERWHEIWALNQGRTQADGSVMTQAGLLRPGWTVLIPATAAPSSPAGTTTVRVVPGDNLTAIAGAHGSTEPVVWDLNKDRQEPDGRLFTDPNLIRPGDEILIPSQHTAPATTAPTTPTPRVPSAPAPPTRSNPATPPAPSRPATPPATGGVSATSSQAPAATAPRSRVAAAATSSSAVWRDVFEGAGGLLAAGLLGALVLRRRRQFRFLQLGRTIEATPPHLLPVEKATVTYGSAAAADERFLDRALRSLVRTGTGEAGATLPDIVAVRMVGDRLELRLQRQHPDLPPAPWRADETGLWWSVSVSDELPVSADNAAEQLAPYPTLVGVGHRPADAEVTPGSAAPDPTREKWLLDLERAGAIALTGDPERCLDLGRFIAAGLAVNDWSDHLSVTMVGFGSELVPLNPQRLRHTEDLDGAADVLAAAFIHAITATDHAGLDVLAGRLHDVAGDSFMPHVLLVAPHVAAERDRLAALLGGLRAGPERAAVAVVLAGDREEAPGTGWTLQVAADGRLLIPALGLDLVAQRLPVEQARGIAEMLRRAEDHRDQPMPASCGDRPYEQFCDAAGALRGDLSLPRTEPPHAPVLVTNGAASPPLPTSLPETTTLLPAEDAAYLQTACTTEEDLQTVAPRVPVEVAARVRAADPSLDDDLTAWRDPDCPLPRLSLLGPIQLRTRGQQPQRMPYYAEIVAFLATREHGAQSEQLADAFNLQVATARRAVNVARDWLGVNPRTGQMHLPDARKSKSSQARGAAVYEIEDLLVDADLFKRLHLRGQACGGDEGIADLEAALSLVSGEPFSQRREGGYEWLVDTPLQHYFVAGITKVAHTVADWALERGELNRAESAALTALLAAPYEEVPRLDLAAVIEARGSKQTAERYLRDEVCNRDDDGAGPLELCERTQQILRRRQWLSQAS